MTEEERKERVEALRRYEDARREHLSGALNLLLGLAAAAVGFCVTRITDKEAVFSAPGSYYLLSATLAFVLTVGLSMLTMWTRLRDFRDTARKIRKELRGTREEDLKSLEGQIDKLGIRTWLLFRMQIVVFLVGLALLSLALWELHNDRLFPGRVPPNQSDGAARDKHLERFGINSGIADQEVAS